MSLLLGLLVFGQLLSGRVSGSFFVGGSILVMTHAYFLRHPPKFNHTTIIVGIAVTFFGLMSIASGQLTYRAVLFISSIVACGSLITYLRNQADHRRLVLGLTTTASVALIVMTFSNCVLHINPSHAANALLICTAGPICLWQQQRKTSVLLTVLAMSALIIHQSLGALSAFVIASMVIMVVARPSVLPLSSRPLQIRTFNLFVWGALLATTLLVTASPWGHKLIERWSGAGDGIATRLSIWRASWNAWLDAPLLGWGLGSYSQVIGRFQPADLNLQITHAHNDYLEWMLETGLIGTAILAALIIFLSRLFVQNRSTLSQRAAWFVIIAFGVHALVDFPFHLPSHLLTLGFVVGGLLFTANRRQNTPAASTSSSVRSLFPHGMGIVIGLYLVAADLTLLKAHLYGPVGHRLAGIYSWHEPLQKKQLVSVDDRAKALRSLQRYGSHPARFYLVEALERQAQGQHFGQITPLIERALELEPHNSLLHVQIATMMLNETKYHNTALAMFKEALAQAPLLTDRALAALRKAGLRSEQWSVIVPNKWSAQWSLSRHLIAEQTWDQAFTLLETLSTDPQRGWQALLQLAKLRLARKQGVDESLCARLQSVETTAAETEDLTLTAETVNELRLARAQCYQHTNRPTQAADLLIKLSCKTGKPAHYAGLATLTSGSTLSSSQLTQLGRCADRPLEWRSHLSLAAIYGHHTLSSHQFFQVKLALSHPEAGPDAYVAASHWYRQANLLPAAAEKLEQAIVRFPRQIGLYLELAALCQELGDSQRVHTTLLKGLEHNPDHPQLLAAMRRHLTSSTSEPTK